MISVCTGAKGLSSIATATNSSDPPKIVRLISMGYQKLKPDTFI